MSALQPLSRFRIHSHGCLVRRQCRNPVEIRLNISRQRLAHHTAVAAHDVTDAQIRGAQSVTQQIVAVRQRGIERRDAGRRPALHLCHDRVDGYVEAPSATKLKVSGISLYAFGPIEPDAGHEVLTYHDPQHGDYRRLLLRDNRIEGAILYGDTAFGPWYFEQSLAGRDLGTCRQALLFGAGDAKPLLEEAA